MIFKNWKSDPDPSLVQTVIEYIQPKQCCLHPHEGCTPSVDYLAHQQLSQEKTDFWKKKIEELKNS